MTLSTIVSQPLQCYLLHALFELKLSLDRLQLVRKNNPCVALLIEKKQKECIPHALCKTKMHLVRSPVKGKHFFCSKRYTAGRHAGWRHK